MGTGNEYDFDEFLANYLLGLFVNKGVHKYYNKERPQNQFLFEGDLETFKKFLSKHRSIIGVHDNCAFDGVGTTIILRDYHLNHYKAYVYGELNPDDIWKILEPNIYNVFVRFMSSTGYRKPFNPEYDKESGIEMSREKEVIIDRIIRNNNPINWTSLRKEYNDLSVNRYIYPRGIKVRYRKTDEGEYQSLRSFDLIYVTIPLVPHGLCKEQMIQLIKDNKTYFDQIAIRSINGSRRFKTSGLTLNLFQLDSLNLRAQGELEYIFGIKKSLLKILNQ